ncbi:hypothetical protein [Pimelobacter simplex]|uniref:hypothetical protein n=1 Tax=Nocardioides simplex TaxID=2045 RepID=UPI003AAB93A0
MASFEHSVRWAFLAAIVVWAPVLLVAYAVGPEGEGHSAPVVVVNLALVALALAGWKWPRLPARAVFLLQHAVFVFNWAHTAGPSTPFAVATYQIFVFAAVAQGLVLRRRFDLLFSVLSCVGVALAVYLVEPSYGSRVAVTVVVTGPLAIVVGRPGLAPLLRFSRSVDANHDESLRATVRLEVQTATLRRAAEEQRQVHDTAINTLAAITRGGQAVADVAAVRDRCRADAVVLERLVSASEREAAASVSLATVLSRRAITVVRPGLRGAALGELWSGLPEGVRSALGGAIIELVTNAEKHAGVDQVVVDVRADGDLAGTDGVRVVVSDQGRGFAPGHVVERGLASSVRARLADEGIALDLRTAPGAGVRAEMTWAPVAPAAPAGSGDFRQDVDRIRMTGALLMSSLVAAGGIALGAASHPGTLTPDYLLSLVVVGVSVAIWRSWRRHERLTGAAAVALVVVAPVAFLISGSSVGFGTGYNLAWQAVAPIGPLFVLVAGARTIRLVMLGVVAYAGVGTAAAVLIAETGAAAATTLVAMTTGLVWVTGWGLFNLRLRAIAARAVREHEVAARAEEAAEAQAAATLVRARWRMAGIESAADLLRALAGTLDPSSDETRRRCGREEAYLREVIQLRPELVHAGAWFCRALATAREREVDLKVRSGTQDVDVESAEQIGRYLVDATTSVAPGTPLVASLFETEHGPQFRLVADDEQVATLATSREWGAARELEIQRYAGQVLVRVGPPAVEARAS